MAKFSCDEMLDPGLSYLRSNATIMYICSAYPTTFTEASATFALASVALTIGNWSGPTTDDDDGRVLELASFLNVPVTATGTRLQVAFCNLTATKIIHVTECLSEYMESGDTVVIPAFTVTYPQPV